MAAKPSIRVVKEFTYRGSVRQFSNRYYFSGGTPSDSGHWTTFSDAVVAAEILQYLPFASGGARVVATFGYAAGSEVPVFSKTYSSNGSSALTGTLPPGDVAAIVRYSTAARSSKNHPIYCFSYYHTILTAAGSGTPDIVLAGHITALGVYAAKWASTGFSDGTNTYKRSSPAGHDVTGYVAETNITHRDLPR
jgi:hypothetical protein